MSEENAVPEVDTGVHDEAPATVVEEGSAAVPAAEAGNAQGGTSAGAATDAVVPPADDLASRIAALEPVAQALLTETLNHVLDGFINHSLVLGMTRLTGLLK